jgi:group I intron endonuclease
MWKRKAIINLLFVYNNYIAYISNMKANKKDKNKSGIYMIRNTINKKVYIGKSKNIYKRINQHIYDLNKKDNRKENSYFINSWKKYGKDAFEYIVLEYLKLEEDILSKKELYWMKVFKSLDRNFGYNLRSDSDSIMITHKDTSKKISERLKKEWLNGFRKIIQKNYQIIGKIIQKGLIFNRK